MQPVESQLVSLRDLGDRLAGLRLCEPSADERMRRSLAQHGQLTGVVAFVDGGQLQLVDGFKRRRAAQRLGWTSLQARVLALEPAMATAVIGVLHEHHALTELEEAWIIRSLCREHGLSQGAAAQLLRRHKSWVSRRLLLVEQLDEAVQADVRLGLLSPRSAVAVAALPRGNQHQAAELVMQRGLTTRQAEALVRRLRALESDQARRAQLKRWPEPSPRVARAGRVCSDAEQVLADVTALMRIGVRLQVWLLQMRLPASGAEVTCEALAKLAAHLETLAEAIARTLALQEKIGAKLANPTGADAADGDATTRRPGPPRDRPRPGHQPQHCPQDPA